MNQSHYDPAIDQWQHVAAEIQDRLADLALKILAARTGLSAERIIGYLAGCPIEIVDHRERIALALEWEPDAIENLLTGEFATDQTSREIAR